MEPLAEPALTRELRHYCPLPAAHGNYCPAVLVLVASSPMPTRNVEVLRKEVAARVENFGKGEVQVLPAPGD